MLPQRRTNCGHVGRATRQRSLWTKVGYGYVSSVITDSE